MIDIVNRLWGAGDLSAVFGEASKVICPWPRVARRKHGPDARTNFTKQILESPVWLTEVDPRALFSSQPWVLRQHAEYYQTGQWELTGITSADRHSDANRFPIIVRDERDRLIISTGHHRSLVALIEGRPLRCRLVPGGQDEAVALLPRLLFGPSARLDHVVCRTANDAVEAIRRGQTVLCTEATVANAACVQLSPEIARRHLLTVALAWSFENALVDVTGRFDLCTTCGDLRADECPLVGRQIADQCSCEPRPDDLTSQQSERRMPCQLCQICGLEVAMGHTRWRFVICGSCRPRAQALNERVGYDVILRGIHSLVNQGPQYELGPDDNEARIIGFADQLGGMFNAISAFHKWGRAMLLDRLQSLGFVEGQVIPLEEYLNACNAAGIDHEDGWAKLEAHLFTQTFDGIDAEQD